MGASKCKSNAQNPVCRFDHRHRKERKKNRIGIPGRLRVKRIFEIALTYTIHHV